MTGKCSDIAKAGTLAAGRKRNSTLEKIRTAIALIERDVEDNAGLYPFNKGRITQQEVLRRARLSSTVLEKPAHRDSLKHDVAKWLDGVRGKIANGRKSIRAEVTDRLSKSEGRLRTIQQAWVLAELEFADMTAKLNITLNEVEKLRKENAALRAELNATNVVPFEPKDR